MANKYIYHTSHTFKDKGSAIEHTFVTQLYQIGVYGILDGRPECQGNYSPAQIVKIEKAQKKSLEKGEITDLVFGREITVHEVDGFWVEVKQEIIES